MAASRIWSPLLRAGAYGSLYGGHPGEPSVGLTVPINSCADLQAACALLNRLNIKATLLIAPELAKDCAEALWATRQNGHEIAGMSALLDFTQLEAVTGQPVRYWFLPERASTRKVLQRLQQAGIAPLPAATTSPAPGAILHLPVSALEQAVTDLKALGYRPLPVSALPDLRPARPRDLFAHLYQRLIEDPYSEREGLIDLSGRFDAVMRIAPLDHAPDPLPLPRNTPTAELHLNSARVVGLASRNLTATYKAYQRSLKDVASALQTHPELQDAQAVFAVTLFHGPLEKAGFTLVDLPPLRARWFGLGFRLLRLAYGTTRASSESTPKMGWMSREAFLARYGGKSAAG